MIKNKKPHKPDKYIVQAKREHYTNLMLITVLEAMVLLIGQLMIYNGFSVFAYTGAIRNVVMPVILAVAAVSLVALLVIYFTKKNRSLIKPIIFAAYVAVLMLIMRYIPNQIGETTGELICNTNKGMRIGAITSAIYILASFVVLYIKSAKLNRKK